jgi:hypothetical protein
LNELSIVGLIVIRIQSQTLEVLCVFKHRQPDGLVLLKTSHELVSRAHRKHNLFAEPARRKAVFPKYNQKTSEFLLASCLRIQTDLEAAESRAMQNS